MFLAFYSFFKGFDYSTFIPVQTSQSIKHIKKFESKKIINSLCIPYLEPNKGYGLVTVRSWLCKKLHVFPEFFDIVKLYFETNPEIFTKVVYKAILRIYPYKIQISEGLINVVIQMINGSSDF